MAGQLKINGTVYEVPASFKLGELRTMQNDFGVDTEKLSEAVERKDMNAIASLVWVVLHRVDATVTPADVDDIDLAEIEGVETAKVAEVVTLPPAGGGAHGSQNGSAKTNDDASDLVTTQPVPGLQ